MQTGKSTVKDVFSGNRVFNVPIYQRAYSWEVDNHLRYFLTDLLNQPNNRKYFLGSFLFHVNGKRDDFDIIDIVDGQQRLTTTLIFLDTLIEKLIEKQSKKSTERTRRTFIKDDDIFKLEMSNESSVFLHNYILGKNLITKNTKTETPAQSSLIEAKRYFKDNLNSLSLEKLESLFDTITEAEVLVYVVEDITTATQIFELLNDRGKKLTDLESIKSFLMYNIGLSTDTPTQLIHDIQANFASIYRLIELHQINDSDVLRYHTIAFCNESDLSAKEFVKKKVSDLVNRKKLVEAKAFIIEYTDKLKVSFDLFIQIRFNHIKSANLDKLFMIGKVAPFYPMLMRTLNDKPQNFDEFVRVLCKFTFKAVIAGLKSSGETYLITAMKNNSDLTELAEAFTRDNWWNINKRAVDVINFDNYYDWVNKNIIKYILFSYENKLRSQKGYPLLEVKQYFSNDEREKLSIEHITAKKSKELEMTDDFREFSLNSIGNLVIDTVSSNSRKSNNNTVNKLQEYNSAPLMSQNEIDTYKCDWKDIKSITEVIEKRDKVLKEFILKELNT